MALVTPVFLDTSVLLGGLIEFGPASMSAQKLVAAIATGKVKRPQTAWHCCLEFYAVSTRLPEEFRLTPGDALRLVEDEILSRFQVHQISSGDHRAFFQVAAQERLAGGRVYDAHIAEVARAAGAAVVVTENRRHFSGLLRHGIRVLTSNEFAQTSRLDA